MRTMELQVTLMMKSECPWSQQIWEDPHSQCILMMEKTIFQVVIVMVPVMMQKAHSHQHLICRQRN